MGKNSYMIHRREEHEENVEICKLFLEGNCTYHEKCLHIRILKLLKWCKMKNQICKRNSIPKVEFIKRHNIIERNVKNQTNS